MAQTLYQFPQLPAEIRVQIWTTYSNIPRTIRLAEKRIVFDDRNCGFVQGFYTGENEWEETCHPPAVLSVNQESRHIGLKYYTLQLYEVFDF